MMRTIHDARMADDGHHPLGTSDRVSDQVFCMPHPDLEPPAPLMRPTRGSPAQIDGSLLPNYHTAGSSNPGISLGQKSVNWFRRWAGVGTGRNL
jgi:hypothetical protein